MRKSDKKTENQLRITLTSVCDSALKAFDGFKWLTHVVNYEKFPQSLQIVCVFDTNSNVSTFVEKNNARVLDSLIQAKLFEIGISLKNITNHITYDTEENCEKYHNGKWADRLS